jgi:hypothetical protein
MEKSQGNSLRAILNKHKYLFSNMENRTKKPPKMENRKVKIGPVWGMINVVEILCTCYEN